MDKSFVDWKTALEAGLRGMLNQEYIVALIGKEHIEKTPIRVIAAFEEMFGGCRISAENALSTVFEDNTTDQMIHVKEITYYSMCAHHLLPFMGTCSFAYIPDGKIVGLSKIPRLVDALARRPQVQEKLTSEIVDEFQRIVKPKGCALSMQGTHMCCAMRGIKQQTSYTETTALRGVFKISDVKAEFLQAVSAPRRY